MSGQSENVIGHIPVVARLAIGIERLVLFVTEARIIVAHLGKRGAGAYMSSAVFGLMSGGVEDVVKSGKEFRSKRALPNLTPQRILSANKENFQMGYGEIVSLRVVETLYSVEMSLLTRDDKFDFKTSLSVDRIIELLRTPLGSRLSVERLPLGIRSRR